MQVPYQPRGSAWTYGVGQIYEAQGLRHSLRHLRLGRLQLNIEAHFGAAWLATQRQPLTVAG